MNAAAAEISTAAPGNGACERHTGATEHFAMIGTAE